MIRFAGVKRRPESEPPLREKHWRIKLLVYNKKVFRLNDRCETGGGNTVPERHYILDLDDQNTLNLVELRMMIITPVMSRRTKATDSTIWVDMVLSDRVMDGSKLADVIRNFNKSTETLKKVKLKVDFLGLSLSNKAVSCLS